MKFLLIVLLALPLFGCSKKPSDMPKLYPCKITVLNAGAVPPHVEVQLAKENETKPMLFHARADGSGVATLKTTYGSYTEPGVPEGEYKVVVNQHVVLETNDPTIDTARESDPAVIAYKKKREAELNEKRVVPATWTNAETTPLSIVVAAGKTNEMKIDIAESAKTP